MKSLLHSHEGHRESAGFPDSLIQTESMHKVNKILSLIWHKSQDTGGRKWVVNIPGRLFVNTFLMTMSGITFPRSMKKMTIYGPTRRADASRLQQ